MTLAPMVCGDRLWEGFPVDAHQACLPTNFSVPSNIESLPDVRVPEGELPPSNSRNVRTFMSMARDECLAPTSILLLRNKAVRVALLNEMKQWVLSPELQKHVYALAHFIDTVALSKEEMPLALMTRRNNPKVLADFVGTPHSHACTPPLLTTAQKWQDGDITGIVAVVSRQRRTVKIILFLPPYCTRTRAVVHYSTDKIQQPPPPLPLVAATLLVASRVIQYCTV